MLARLGDATGWVQWALRAVDLLLVYYVIYRILLLIKGTRAIQMLMGLFLIIGAFFASRLLGLTTLHWLIGNFLSYSFIFAVIVLFQHDIRRGLQRLGGTSFLGAQDPGAETARVEEMVKGAAALASRRLGALIVVERTADLDDYVGQGVRLDAEVSRELLLSIFHPASPLHDGAAVIQKGRLAAAAVFLPLTSSPTVARDLGTRHRAALGLSEEVDAAVVVVSEERGQISLALEGQLTRDMDQATLRKVLLALVAPENPGLFGRLRRSLTGPT